MDSRLFVLAGGIILVLLAVIIWQRTEYQRQMQKKLREITADLEKILDTESKGKVMVFTDQQELMDLLAQINRLLEDRQKTKADYRRQENASRKMLANVSHDMKTPLTVILGYLEIMRLNQAEDPMLQKVEEKAKQVVEMVDAFFLLAKLEAGDMPVNLERIDVAENCREAILSFYELLQKNGFHVEIIIPEAPVYAIGDGDGLQRILANLITNAVRYGRDGKYLGIQLREEDSTVCIDVVDKGKGIEKEFAENVFERLYTLEDSRNRKIQGNGLGLTIARNLAQSMGGTVTLESEPGVRTVFTVTLSRRQDALWEKRENERIS